jgi:phosphate transport system substrate-binding protein
VKTRYGVIAAVARGSVVTQGVANLNWFSPENIVAMATAVFGLVVPAAGAIYQRRSPRGKRIGYRVQMDTAIGGEGRDRQGGRRRLRLTTKLPRASNASLVLLRIENDGTGAIAETDYTNPDRNYGLIIEFTGRHVEEVDVIPDPKATHLLRHLQQGNGVGGLHHNGNTIRIPRIPLNEKRYFKLLVLLSGGRVGSEIDVTGDIQGGKIQRTRSMSVDDKPRLFSKVALSIMGALAAGLVALASIIIFGQPQPTPMGCVEGKLRIIGSTAFAPAMGKLADQYMKDCPDSDIGVDAHGSTEGVRELANAGTNGTADSPAVIALSDGPRPADYSQLKERRVAIVAFALVVNSSVNIKDLTTDQIRHIFAAGDIVNWKEVGGPDLPIRLISRDADSGTRDLFRRRVLGGSGEPAFTSRDCVHTDSEQDELIRCELGSTNEVLTTVARLPGAIGYGELVAAANSTGLRTLAIGGKTPSIEAISAGAYPFTDIEYAYTNGTPAAGSLAFSFLNFMTVGNGQSILNSYGHPSCYSPEGLKRCRP